MVAHYSRTKLYKKIETDLLKRGIYLNAVQIEDLGFIDNFLSVALRLHSLS